MIRLFLGLAAVAAPLHFDHLPLGSAARVLSARYHAQITILAKATTLVSGEFSQLTISQALALIASQAGLVVRSDETGFVIGPKLPESPPSAAGRSATALPPEALAKAGGPSVSSAAQRAILLRRRAELLQQAAKLTAP